jgi:DNA-binding MarR family transcriptional regulator
MMERVLIEFIDTLDASLKKLQKEAGVAAGFANLTISQLQYIDAVHALGNPAVSEIADRLRVSKASATAGVNKLIKRGYLTKSQSEQDRRVFHVQLTAAGRQLVGAKYQALAEYEAFALGALTPEEAAQFQTILMKLIDRFKEA